MSRAITLILLTALPAALLTPAVAVQAAVVTQWTFNTNPSDNTPTTGTLIPETGAGTIAGIGGVSSEFRSGSQNDNSPAATGSNNSALDASGFPPFDSGNKTAGIQIAVNTTGFEDIVLSFNHHHAPGAASSFRIQYSTDGVNFTDGDGYTANAANVFSSRSQDFSAIPSLDDNPNARFRIVAEFTGQVYSGTGQSYMPGAHHRFDLVTVSGTPVPEPAAGAFAVLAMLGFTLRRRR